MSELNLQINMDEPVQLLFISDALRSIALHQGADASLLNGVKTTEEEAAESIALGEVFDNIVGDMSVTKTVEFEQPVKVDVEATIITPPTLDELAVNDMDEALAATTNIVTPPVTTDAPEIPWDARIHSKNKTTNADGSFKMRKKPADQTKEQWTSYVEAVEVELKQLMNPTPVTYSEPVVVEPVIVDGDVVGVSVGHVVEQQDASTVFAETPPVVVTPPVVTETPPVVVTPPVVTETPPVVAEGDQPKTFGELMKFVTTNKVKLTPDACNEVLKAHGIEKWPLLATKLNAQPDFMNTIYPALKALV